MALAVLILTDGSIKPIHDQQAATNLYTAWKSNKPATEAQKAFIQNVRKVILPPSWKAAAGIKEEPAPNELFHPGIPQGRMMQLPNGDRD